MFNNLSNSKALINYRHLFDYLNYQPIIKVEYMVGSYVRNSSGTTITPELLIKYLDQKHNDNSFRGNYIKSFHDSRKEYIPELCHLINKINTVIDKEVRRYQILINFSESNIIRMHDEGIDYTETTREFLLLGLLDKLGLLRRAAIKAYKEDDSEFDFHEASSGEVNVLSTLIALIPLLTNGCLVLIDEPEISLHPSWQYRYIDLLLKIFENVKGCHVIIASHSHFLVSDLPINSSTVITLVNDKGIIKSEMIQESTYGWSVEDILFNVFKLPTVRNYYLYQLVTRALEMLGDYERPQEEFDKIKLKIMFYEPYIKDSDPLKEVIESIINVKAQDRD